MVMGSKGRGWRVEIRRDEKGDEVEEEEEEEEEGGGRKEEGGRKANIR